MQSGAARTATSRCAAREDLANHTLLHTSGGYDDDWRLWLTAAGLPTNISKQPGLSFDLIFMTVQAAIDGIGVAMGRTSYVEADIAKGRLVVPFKITLPADAGFYLVSPEARGRSAQARGVPAMAEGFGAGQSLKQFTSAPVSGSIGVFRLVAPRRRGRLPHQAEYCRLARSLSAHGQSQRGEVRHVANIHVTAAADQVAHRRHPARDQRQFPRAVRFLPVRLLRLRHRQGVLSRQNETAALLNAFGVFWLGALMRPVGAVVLGAYIDRIGRRQGLIVTLAIMAIGTVVIAFCPTYATIGVAAPVIVLIGRLLQGFSAGVELGGVSVYLSEIATPGNRGFYTSFQSSSQQVAIFVAAILGFILSEMMPGGYGCGMGLAHSVLRRLPHHSRYFPAAADAGGNAGIPGHEETSDRKRGIRLGDGELAHRRSRHDDRGTDHHDLLLRHGLYADLRQDRAETDQPGRAAGHAAGGRDQLHLESGRAARSRTASAASRCC